MSVNIAQYPITQYQYRSNPSILCSHLALCVWFSCFPVVLVVLYMFYFDILHSSVTEVSFDSISVFSYVFMLTVTYMIWMWFEIKTMKLHLRVTGCHLSCGITQCYLPPDTCEHTPEASIRGKLRPVFDLPTLEG